MRVRGAISAIAVLSIVFGAIALVFLKAEDLMVGRSEVAAAAVTEPVQAPADAVAAPAPAAPDKAAAAVAPSKAKAAPQVPVKQTFADFAPLQRQLLGEVDSWWVSALRRAGLSYSGPKLTIAARGDKKMSQCGRAVASPQTDKKAYPAFYCRGDRTVYISAGWLYDSIFANFHRGGVAAIIAHEFGHHVQHSIGIADPKVSRQELQADCLAGVWMRSAVASGELNANDVKDGRKALRALGDTQISSKLHHGTPAERTSWFDRGYASGDAYNCNH